MKLGRRKAGTRHRLLTLPSRRSSRACRSGLFNAFAQPGSEKLPLASRQLISIEELAGERKVLVDAHDKQLLEVALTLDDHLVAGFLGRNGLHLDELTVDGPVGARAVRPMAA